MNKISALQGNGADNNGRNWRLFVVAGLLGCVLAYFPALNGPLFFDDLPNITENSYLAVEPGVFDSWRVAMLSNESGVLRRPLASFTFALNHALVGEWSPFVLKATNLGLHLFISLLLYHWFHLLLCTPALRGSALFAHRRELALLAAGLWLLHPLHVSTVLYSVQRMAQLSTLFIAGGLYLFTRYRLRWAESGATSGEVIAAGLWLLVLTTAGVLSKENGVLLPWLVAAVEVCLFRGVWAGGELPALRRLGWFILLLPPLLVMLAFALDPGLLDARYARREFTLSERLLTQSRLLWQYLGWTLFPNLYDLGFYHDDIPVSSGLLQPFTTLIALLGWVLAGMAGLFLAVTRRLPLIVFALFFYLIGHSMESSFWPLEMVYEHRNYLPSAVVCLLIAAAVFHASTRVHWLRLGAAAAFLLLACNALLALRASFWVDELTLARHTVINHPQSPRANFFYGNALFKAFEQREELGLSEEERAAFLVSARGHFVQMHELDPGSFSPLVMLYQLDNNFFPELPDRPDWLQPIRDSAATRSLHSSDRTALEALARFAVSTPRPEDNTEVDELLAALIAHHPRRADLRLYRHRLLAADEGADKAQLQQVLENITALRADELSAFPHLVVHHGNQDKGAGYDVVRRWMARDTLRMDLLLISRLFEQVPPE
ncbi:MAG: hypothetical protein Hals2KO_36750 [Halioglobus sp.]